MRVWVVCAAAILCLPGAVAEFGIEEDGYPVSADGFSHRPAERFDAEALAELQERAWADLGQEPPLNQVGPATLYPYYPILAAEIQRLALEHPDKVRLHVAGKSELGLDLTFLEVADFAALAEGRGVPVEERQVVWIDGGTHSNEYSGVYFVLALAQWLLDGSPDDAFAQWVLENRHTWIMPMVNPDGSHVMGRLNANLVNINRNYPVIWGGQGTDDLLNNPGPAPASEVETQINIEWLEKLRPDYYASIHCCGNLWLYPYGEDGYDPLDNATLATICREALPDVLEDCGPIWSTIYPASGSSVDTAYEYTGAAAFGFEMSGRSNLVGIWGEPITFEEVAVQERESWGAIMHAFENVHLYGGHVVIRSVAMGADHLEITLHNDGYGPVLGGNVTVRDESAHTHEILTTALPAIAAGETVTVRADKPMGGKQTVGVEYQQRIMAAPHARMSFELAGIGNGTHDVLGIPLLAAEPALASDQQEAPLSLLVIVVALALAVVRSRR